MARIPLRNPGWVVTSLTRSPPSQTSRSWARKPSMYCCPVRAGIRKLGGPIIAPAYRPHSFVILGPLTPAEPRPRVTDDGGHGGRRGDRGGRHRDEHRLRAG